MRFDLFFIGFFEIRPAGFEPATLGSEDKAGSLCETRFDPCFYWVKLLSTQSK
jgi:hypothetical protein